MKRSITTTLLTAPLLLIGAVTMLVVSAPPVRADDEPSPPDVPALEAEDAEAQAAVLAAEDRRITEVRTVTSLARWENKDWKTPYRLGTSSGYTLVLTPSTTPYTIDDLLELAPQTFVRMTDGSLLLSEHIVVLSGAVLQLSDARGLRLRLASGPEGFATIVSFGGEIDITGEEGAVVNIESWNIREAASDDQTTDGRAYIRAIGGQFHAAYATFTDLGFWSGRTGGLALTGTDRPDVGSLDRPDVDESDAPSPSVIGDVTWQEAGPLSDGQTNQLLDYTVPARDYVSAQLQDVTVTGGAYGLFVSGANGVQVTDSTFTDNLLGGVMLHRYVNNGVITRTTSTHNVGDGFGLSRATTGIVISESTANYNGGSGFSLDGRALAEAPSAVGASLSDYGNNSVSTSSATGNGRHGIEVLGGFNIGVQNNTVAGHDMGITVRGPARQVSITGNTIDGAERHGLALVDGVVDSTVTGNVISDVKTGVYLRGSTAEVKGNTIDDASLHGVSLVGDVDGASVTYNVLAGSGASAVDAHRRDGDTTIADNNTSAWHDTSPWYHWFKKLLQPMSILWSVIVVLVVMSALRSRRRYGAIQHPYAHQMAHHGHMPIPEPSEHVTSTEMYEPV